MLHLASQTALTWYWLWHPLAGPGYQFYSGIVGDISQLTLLGLALGAWRHVNCHAHRCWRLGRHHVEGTPYVTCAKHHPEVPAKPTAQHIAQAHGAVRPE